MIDLPFLALLLPLPFLIVAILAILSRNGRNNWLSIAGLLAGAATLAMAALTWSSPGVEHAWHWFDAAGLSVSWIIMRDPLALTLAALVGGIGALVFLYSGGYFERGEDLRRYYLLLALFASSMIMAVTAGDLLQLLFAWEIVGVTSFLLIGFWNRKESAVRAARKAFLTIIVGDAGLLGGIVALAVRYHTTSISRILVLAQPDAITILAAVGILIGAMSKSAQFPLHDWLPDAMEGPTPVSAFLHSAAMVKAGVFLVARMLPLLLLAGLGPCIVLVAIITMLLAAGLALVENDIKRVLAYSTMNHLAIILLALGLGASAAALTHIVMHSVTKSMLFFTAGILIHASGTQDLTKMRFSKKSFVLVCALIGALALAGLPPLAAALSKDAVLEAALASGDPVLAIALVSAMIMGAAYLIRWYLLLTTPLRDTTHVHADARMRAPLPLLLLCAAFGALALPGLHALGIAERFHWGVSALLSLVFAATGALLAWAATRTKVLEWLTDSPLAEAARARFLVDDAYTTVGGAVFAVGRELAHGDDALVNRSTRSAAQGVVVFGSRLRKTVSGSATAYALAILLGALGLLLLVRWSL